jgi:hypothetical protein
MHFNSIQDFAEFRVKLIRKMSRKFKGIRHEERAGKALSIFRDVLTWHFDEQRKELTNECIRELEDLAIRTVSSYSAPHIKWRPELAAILESDREFMNDRNRWYAFNGKDRTEFAKRHESDQWWYDNMDSYCPVLKVQRLPFVTMLCYDNEFIGTKTPIGCKYELVHGIHLING